MKKLTLAVLLLLCACSVNSPRTVEDFNFGWKFSLVKDTIVDINYAATDYDDCSWRDLHLPHDWSVEGEFSPNNPATIHGGALPGGIGWYRKQFDIPEIAPGKRCFVEFDGVYMNSHVFINGSEVGYRPYGYSSFCYDITDLLVPGANTIAVCCDNFHQPNSRWYSGSGIYRDVRIVWVQETHIAYNGLFITTPEISKECATIDVKAEIEGMHDGISVKYMVEETGTSSDNGILKIEKPRLWDVDDPYLYTLVVEIEENGILLDRYEEKFGIRDFVFDCEKGFFLNGRALKIKGVCLHHDMGCLGSAVHKRALERELVTMKNMGINAVRTSHNPPAPQLLDLCDQMGLLVMDEAFDMWKKHKREYDYATYFDQWHKKDMQDFVKRDRNHPSIIMWSIGNEILEQWTSDGYDQEDLAYLSHYGEEGENPSILLSRHLAALIREMDTTRYIIAGGNDVSKNNLVYRSGALDILGLNYAIGRYDSMHVWFPGVPLMGSETVSAFNTRGVYREDEKQQKVAYDIHHAGWGCTAEEGWIAIRDREFMAGTFIWTGFDYLGEPTPYGWPSRSSYFGIVDLAGFPKDSYWMYMGEWTNTTFVHLLPHWNWNIGDSVNVWAYYGQGDDVELILNGKSLGHSHKEGNRLHALWEKVPFSAGKLEAVLYKDGQEVARDCKQTASAPAKLLLKPDRQKISADGYDLSYIEVTAVDSCGIDVPEADEMLTFSVKGSGELLGIDNGNPIDTLCLKGDRKRLFKGKALAVVRSLANNPGTATLTVSGYGKEYTVDINCK